MCASTVARARARFKYLAKTDAFRERPVRTLARALVWAGCCAAGHSPEFPLSPGARFRVEPGSDHSGSTSAFVLRDWAEPELRFLHLLVSRGDVFIDCGANIGAYTVKAATLVGRHGHVVAIEPGTESYRKLSDNIGINGFSNVTLLDQAVSDREARTRLHHSDGGPASFSLVRQDNAPFEEVDTTTLDQIVRHLALDRVDCIKMDVEGFEQAALTGAVKTLRRFRPTVIFEITSPSLRRSGGAADAVPRLLRDQGYRFHQLLDGTLGAGVIDIDGMAGMTSPNCVAIHRSRPPSFGGSLVRV